MTKEMLSWIKEQFSETNQLSQKTLEYDNKLVLLFYVKTLVDFELMQKAIIRPFFEMKTEQQFSIYLQALPQYQNVQSKEQALSAMIAGNILAVIENDLYLLDFKSSKNDQIMETTIETTIHGSQISLSDNLNTSINVIRSYYQQASLAIEYTTHGEVDQQKVAIIYDVNKVDMEVLNTIREKLQDVDKQLTQASAQFNNWLNTKKRSLFPKMLTTERPDRIVYNIAGGKVVLLADGNPQAVVAPAVFFDFMSTMEDNFHSFWITNFIKFLRYAGLLISIILPGLYVGTTTFSPAILRTELALTVAGSRIGVPFTPFIEVLFMLFFMELLVEASIRLPKAVSSTATTVGGLILGTAVTEAALASNIMVIIVAAVAISTFVIPVNELAFSIRVVRLVLLFVTTIFGMAGLTLGILALVMYLSNVSSFGQPYLRFYNMRKTTEDWGT